MLFFAYENFLIVLKCKKEIRNIEEIIVVKKNIFLLRNNIIKYSIPIYKDKDNKKNKRSSKINCVVYLFLLPQKIDTTNKKIILKPISRIIEKYQNGNINNKFAKEILNEIENNSFQIFFKKIDLD